jgi:hypothetical protein
MREVKLELNARTAALLKKANAFTKIVGQADESTGIHLWSKLFGSRSRAAKVALDYALRSGIRPQSYEGDYETANGRTRPLYPLPLDLDRRFDHLMPKEIASTLSQALEFYVGGEPPENGRARQRYKPTFELDDRTLKEIAVIAFGKRRTSEEEVARFVDLALPRILPTLPEPEESLRTVLAPVDTEQYSTFRSRVMDLGWDPEVLITLEIRKMLAEGVTP